jgi:hypothetical protein
VPIKNYTTEVGVDRTIGEISSMLASHGARSVQVDYDGKGKAEGVGFNFPVAGQMIHFRLPANVEGVQAALQKNPDKEAARRGHRKVLSTEEQARKVAWRILKDWVAAQMAIVEAGAAQLAEVFLPYAVQADGKTVYQAFEENQQKQLRAKNHPAKSA